MILSNGIIRTMASAAVVPELALDRDLVVRRLDGRRARDRVDLGGRCVLPGFTDAHVHFPTWSMGRRWLSLAGCESRDEVLKRVKGAMAGARRDQWLIGFDWASADWTPRRAPSRAALDAVTGDLPVALWSNDLHTLWLNSAGLGRARGDLGDRDVIELDASGEPTGILGEDAAWRFRARYIDISVDEYADATIDGIAAAHARGVTAVHDKDGWLGAPRIWERVRERGALTLRVWQSVPHDQAFAYERGPADDGFLRVGYLKVFMDGSVGSNTAHMFDGSGVVTTTGDELAEILRTTMPAGWPVAVHAIGDKANRDALDAFEATRAQWRPRGLRHRIEHAMLLHPDDLPRFAALGVACSVQFTDAALSRDVVDDLEPGVSAEAFPFRSLLESGAFVVNGSDAPLTELDPLLGLRSAVLRTLDARPAWRPEQGVTIHEALAASTVRPPFLSGDEYRRGTLVPGRLADLVVLDRDPVTCPPEELADVKVVATMVAGRWVHNPPPWE